MKVNAKHKRWIVTVLALIVLAALAFGVAFLVQRAGPQPQEHVPGAGSSVVFGNESPTGAVIGFTDALRNWDMGLAAQLMSHAPESIFTEAYHNVLTPVLSRLEVEVGAEQISGDIACVDASVLAVDFGGTLADMSADAASYLATSVLYGTDADWSLFLSDYLAGMNAGELLRVRRDAPVYLVRDSGGHWRIDTENTENAAFFSALTGGLPESVERLRTAAGLAGEEEPGVDTVSADEELAEAGVVFFGKE